MWWVIRHCFENHGRKTECCDYESRPYQFFLLNYYRNIIAVDKMFNQFMLAITHRLNMFYSPELEIITLPQCIHQLGLLAIWLHINYCIPLMTLTHRGRVNCTLISTLGFIGSNNDLSPSYYPNNVESSFIRPFGTNGNWNWIKHKTFHTCQ